jgi:hypothetical protein
MQPGRGPRPPQILDELLTTEEAAAQQRAAAYRQALVVCSRVRAGRERAAVQAARLGYEQLLHRFDPGRRRPVQAGEGLLLLAVVVAGVNVLDGVELGPPLAGSRLLLATLAANVAWLTLTWIAGVAGREQHWTVATCAAGGASLLALLLAAVHGTDPRRGWPTAWGEDYRSSTYGILLGVLLLALGTGAAVLIAHTEPAACCIARYRWHRARARYEAAWERQLASTQAASAATAAWLGLVRRYAGETAGGDHDVVEATVALASDLLANGRPGSPPAMPSATGLSPCATLQRPRPAPAHGARGRDRAG